MIYTLNDVEMKVDLSKLDKLVEKKYLRKTKHPQEDLWIYNYSEKCQYEKFWTKETLMCRGLIVDAKGNVKARPFPKFFNLGEHKGRLPIGSYEVFDKLDGSLGILYWVGDSPYISTRGSFISDQAVWATGFLRNMMMEKEIPLMRDRTYLFEIIYPENRIVVNYDGLKTLILLDCIHIRTGKSVEPGVNWPMPEQYHLKIKDLPQRENKEGYVLKWKNGFRLKVKHDEYVRLHRIVTGINSRRIWEMLSRGESLEEILDRVPDEFYDWVERLKDDLETQFKVIRSNAGLALKTNFYDKKPRKEAATDIMKNYKEIAPVIFKMMDGNPVDDLIWKMIKPKHSVPFNVII